MPETVSTDPVSGFLHRPAEPNGRAVALTHGAGGDARMPLLSTVADALAANGFVVLRYDLPFRRKRAKGSPSGSGAADREGVAAAIALLREQGAQHVYAAGQSYGGRQSSMLLAEQPDIADGLLLLSYPLHPPGKAEQLRTAHFPSLKIPTLFVSGTKDPFGSPDELTTALTLIPGKHELVLIEGAGHDLKRGRFDLDERLVKPFLALIQS